MPRKAVSNAPNDCEENIDFEMSIEPDKEPTNKNSKQTGSIYITIPYNFDTGKELINAFAFLLTQKISFDFGEMKVHTGMIMCEHLPETPEEKEQLGDRPYSAIVNLVEVVDPPKFDPKIFAERSNRAMDLKLVAQYNESRRSQNQIEKFLGFFKILESQFPPQNKKQTLQQSLETNDRLFKIYSKTFEFDSEQHAENAFKEFVKAIVHVRHRCAHLKTYKNYGYLPADPKTKQEIEPLLTRLEILTYETIRAM